MGLYTSTHSSFTFHSSNLCVVSKIMDEIRDLRSGSHGHREFRRVRTYCCFHVHKSYNRTKPIQVLLAIHLFWFACIGWVAFHEDTYEKHIKKPDVTGQDYCDVFYPNGCTWCSSVQFENIFFSNNDSVVSLISTHTRYQKYSNTNTIRIRTLNSRFALEHRYRLFLSSP